MKNEQKANENKPNITSVIIEERDKIKEVILSLDLQYKGLGAVSKAIESENTESASEKLLGYFKAKYKNIELPSKLHDNDRKIANDALNHLILGNRHYKPVQRGDVINWYDKAVIDGKTIDDEEWLFQFHRLTWWKSLAKAYAVTKDNAYFDEWYSELISYNQNVLPITSETPYFIKRGMETYYRCLTISSVLPMFLQSDKFNEKVLIEVLWFFHQQAEHIRTVYAKRGNHLLGELTSVYKNSLAFPEFKKASEWKNEACKRIPQMMEDEIYSDGMNWELVFSYHSMYIDLFYDFYLLLKKNDELNLLPPFYTQRLKKMHQIYAQMVLPDNTIPQFGDAWKYAIHNNKYVPKYTKLHKNLVKHYPDDEYLKYLSSRSVFDEPKQKSFSYPESGFYALRSQWGEDGLTMILKNGEEAAFHNQFDNQTFCLYAYGRNFMTDSGSYIYSGNKSDTAMREKFRSTAFHQCMTLNNKNLKRNPKFVFWENQEKITVLTTKNESYKDLYHRRTVFMIDDSFYLIHDEAIGKETGDVRFHFQLAPMPIVVNAEQKSVSTSNLKGSNIFIKSFSVKGDFQYEKEEGLISYIYTKKEDRPAWSLKSKKSDAAPKSLLTLIAPSKNKLSDNWRVKVSEEGSLKKYSINSKTCSYAISYDLEKGLLSFFKK